MSTINLHRVFKAAPEKIYRAFLDADAQTKWLPPNGFTCKVHHLDAKVGGTYKMSFTNFTTGKSQSFGGKYLELVENESIRYTDQFDDQTIPEILSAIAATADVCSTLLDISHKRMPAHYLSPTLSGLVENV